jgi:hypothetical protein
MLFIIKSAITLALLYSCFFLFLSKETFHRFNRIMLVSIMFVSLITPLFHITTDNPSLISEEFHMVQTLIEETPATVLAPAEDNIPTWMDLLTWIYMVGVTVMTIITIAQIISLVRFMSGGLRHTDSQGNTVILHNCEFPPFSIFRYIVMSVKDY